MNPLLEAALGYAAPASPSTPSMAPPRPWRGQSGLLLSPRARL